MSILLTSLNFFSNFLEKEPFIAKNSIKWAKNGQLTLEMALMKDETYVLSIMMQKWDESAQKISKNGPKWGKNPQNLQKFRPLVNFESLLGG